MFQTTNQKFYQLEIMLIVWDDFHNSHVQSLNFVGATHNGLSMTVSQPTIILRMEKSCTSL